MIFKQKILLILVLLSGLCLTSAPILKSTSLRQGNTTVKFSNTPGLLAWVLENPDAQEEKVTIQLSPTNGNRNEIFSCDVYIPPKTSLTGTFPVVIGDSDTFLVELIHKGNRIFKDNVIAHPKPNNFFSLAIYNDNESPSALNKIQKNKAINYQIATLTYNVSNVPTMWSMLQATSAVVLYKPDLSKYTIPQMTAIIDYVAQGGTLIIATPEAAMAMKDTILAELLPYDPISIKYTMDLSSIAAAFNVKNYKNPPVFDENGIPSDKLKLELLNFIPNSDSTLIPTVGTDSFAAMKYHGMGNVIGLAFNPFKLCNYEEAFAPPFWNMIMSNTKYLPPMQSHYTPSKANETLQQLQGYKIPQVSYILNIMLAYIIGAAVILGIMFKLKRHSQGWLLACVYGLLITAFIMICSRNISTNKATLNLANIGITTWDGNRGPSLNNALLLSHSDTQAKIQVKSDDVFLRQQPIPHMSAFNASSISSTPLWIIGNGLNTHLERMVLQQQRPRTFQWLENSHSHGMNKAELPEFEYLDNDIRLKDWTLPNGIQPSCRAVLILNSGVRYLVVQNGIVHDNGSTAMLEADTVLTSAINYISAFSRITPVLAIITQNPDGKELPLNFGSTTGTSSAFDYDILMVHVQFPQNAAPKKIPAAFNMPIVPLHSQMRNFLKQGSWLPVIMHTTSLSLKYDINFKVIPVLSSEAPEQIEINLDTITSGIKIQLTPRLIANDGTLLEPTQKDGKKYIFRPEGKNVISPLTSYIGIEITANVNSSIAQMSTTSRQNFWQITELSAEIINK